MFFIKRVIYLIFLFLGIFVVVFLMKSNGSSVGVLALFTYVFIYKPICDAIFLHLFYNFKVKDLKKKYPYWSSEIRRKLYFEKQPK
jgi:hypothetical protein